MRAVLACAAWLLASPAAAAEDAALAAIEDCRSRLDPRADVGLERIEKRCPDLMSTIEKAPWFGLVPADLRARRDELSSEGLRALSELVRGANRELSPRAAPPVETLAPLLAELGEQGQQGATRWERFKRWLQEKLERRNDDKDEDSWLEELGREFQTSEGVARVITYVGYTFLGALVLLVVISELRAAGLLRARRREAQLIDPRARWRRRLQLSDVARAPLSERPGLLLRLLGEALARAHRLPAADGLTASAIAQRARLDEESDRAQLGRVAATADAVRYGPTRPPDPVLEDAASVAASLLERLTRSTSRRG
jgi:hypothetical protein